jgi:hypothetical protein
MKAQARFLDQRTVSMPVDKTLVYTGTIDDLRALVQSLICEPHTWTAPNGEQLHGTEVVIPHGIPLNRISSVPPGEREKLRDPARACFIVQTSRDKDAYAIIDVYGVGNPRVIFRDGHLPMLYPYKRPPIGEAFEQFQRVIGRV